MHKQLYCVEAHLFQLCKGQGSVQSTVQSAHTSQTNWTSVYNSVVDICTATVSQFKVADAGETTINSLEISIKEIIDDIHNPETKENNQNWQWL